MQEDNGSSVAYKTTGTFSVTRNATRRQPVGRTPTSWQQPCTGTQWVALAKQGLLDLPPADWCCVSCHVWCWWRRRRWLRRPPPAFVEHPLPQGSVRMAVPRRRGGGVPLPPGGGSLGCCTCAQEAISTKSAGRKWLVSGLEDHRYLFCHKECNVKTTHGPWVVLPRLRRGSTRTPKVAQGFPKTFQSAQRLHTVAHRITRVRPRFPWKLP